MAVTDATRLSIYNDALLKLGSRQLASVSENREPRRVMDSIWNAGENGLVGYALEKGEWNFALRTVEGVYSSSVTPPFGFRRAFEKPEDVKRLAGLSASPSLKPPLTDNEYTDEAGFWFTNHDVIYIRYVSDLDDYGMNGAIWSESFKEYLACRMAWLGCERITNSTAKRDRIERDMGNALKGAKSNDSMAEGVKFFQSGSWVRSRTTGRGPEW